MLEQSGYFVTVDEVAVILRRSPRTVRRWCEQGQVFSRSTKIMGLWLIPRSELLEVIHGPHDAN